MKDLEANNMLDSAMSRASVTNSIGKPWEDIDALNSNWSSMAMKKNTNQTYCCGERAELNCTTFKLKHTVKLRKSKYGRSYRRLMEAPKGCKRF